MNLGSQGKSLGSLKSASNDELIYYEPYEFSQHSIGILSPKPLSLGAHLVLDSHRNGNLTFKIAHIQKQGDIYRYRLVMAGVEDLTKKLDIDPRSGKIKYDRHNNPLQYARFSIEPQVYVHAKTFGSASIYVLQSVDVSQSGILLCAPQHYGAVPFIAQTLLELKLDLAPDLAKRPIETLGKVVRVSNHGLVGSSKRYFGVKLLEFSPEQQQLWLEALARVEESAIGSSTRPMAA